MIKENFLVFCITIFSRKTQNKNKVGIKTTFLLMMKNTWSKYPYTSSLSSRAGRKDIFWKTNNKHINWADE